MENFGSWSVLTTHFLIILYLGLGGALLPAILHLVDGEWRYQIRDYSCAFISLLPIAFILLLILLVNGDSTFLSLAQETEFSFFSELSKTNFTQWNNYGFLIVRETLGLMIVAGLSYLFVSRQNKLTENSTELEHKKYHHSAISLLFAYVIYGTMVAWDFEMTMMADWHSAIYAAYHFVSNFHGFLALFTLVLFFIQRSGKYKFFDEKVFNSMAQLLLGFTLLWIYFFFSQYIIIWYGRLPFEINRFNFMMYEGFGNLWWTFLAFKFFIPFIGLAVFTPFRHRPTLVSLLAIFIVIGTWLERYTWIAGSIEPEFYHQPMTAGFDILVSIALFALCWLTIKRSLKKSVAI